MSISINLKLTEAGRDALDDSRTVEVIAMYLVDRKYDEEPKDLPESGCLIDARPSGTAGSYLGHFENPGNWNFIGRSLIITFVFNNQERVFSYGNFAEEEYLIVKPGSAEYVQYSYNLIDETDKTVWFNNNATYATFAEKIGTANNPTNTGSATKPVYLENGEFKECEEVLFKSDVSSSGLDSLPVYANDDAQFQPIKSLNLSQQLSELTTFSFSESDFSGGDFPTTVDQIELIPGTSGEYSYSKDSFNASGSFSEKDWSFNQGVWSLCLKESPLFWKSDTKKLMLDVIGYIPTDMQGYIKYISPDICTVHAPVVSCSIPSNVLENSVTQSSSNSQIQLSDNECCTTVRADRISSPMVATEKLNKDITITSLDPLWVNFHKNRESEPRERLVFDVGVQIQPPMYDAPEIIVLNSDSVYTYKCYNVVVDDPSFVHADIRCFENGSLYPQELAFEYNGSEAYIIHKSSELIGSTKDITDIFMGFKTPATNVEMNRLNIGAGISKIADITVNKDQASSTWRGQCDTRIDSTFDLDDLYEILNTALLVSKEGQIKASSSKTVWPRIEGKELAVQNGPSMETGATNVQFNCNYTYAGNPEAIFNVNIDFNVPFQEASVEISIPSGTLLDFDASPEILRFELYSYNNMSQIDVSGSANLTCYNKPLIPGRAFDSDVSYDTPSSNYLLVTPAQIKQMIDAAISEHMSSVHS